MTRVPAVWFAVMTLFTTLGACATRGTVPASGPQGPRGADRTNGAGIVAGPGDPGATAAEGAQAVPGARAPAPPDPDLVYYLQAAPGLHAAQPAKLEAVDFRRLRRGSMLNHGGTSGDEPLEKQLEDAISTRDERRILEATTAVLAKDVAHIRAHVVRDNLLRKTGKSQEAEFHRTMVKGLLASIFATGTGKSAGSAFRVFHVREEYDLLRFIQLEVVSQALDVRGQQAYDVLRVKRPDGQLADMFFDVSELFALSTKALSGG